MLWRFIPVLDPSVSVMVSRDLDSRITYREQAAVEEWLESGLAFHVMRDHPWHKAEILAGMWGARMDSGARGLLESGMERIMEDVLFVVREKKWYKGLDQDLLKYWIWPLVRNQTCVHDSYLCQTFKSNNWRPFPTQRGGDFVGAVGGKGLNQTCPVECRPPQHQEWIFC